MMNAIALFRENPDPTDEEILEYLSETFAVVPVTRDGFGRRKSISPGKAVEVGA